MARTSRNYMKNSSFFHIMVQGINQEYIFNTSKDKNEYIKLIYSNNIGVQIIHYCIMDNHAHMLIQTEDVHNIGIWMRKTNTSYAIYYNKRKNRVGYVFRNRYKAQPIKNEKHLYLCINYIHDNPVKAGICKSKEEYPFSSYSRIYQANQKQVQNNIQQIVSQCMLQEEHCREEMQSKFELIEDEKENKQEKCRQIINHFLITKKLTLEELKKDENHLKEIVRILKYENGIAYRVMEKNLKISREKLRRLIVNEYKR